MMDHDRPSGLDPTTDPVRWERMVHGVMAAAAPELERRRAAVPLLGALLSQARPALSAAAAVAVLLSASLALVANRAAEVGADDAPLASVLVPDQVAAWLVADYEPTVTEIVVALETVPR